MWVISLCAWTPYYRAKLKMVALPSINAALAHATGPIQFILHTDVDIRLFQPDPSALYQSFGNADRLALESAPEDANIAFLTSDIMVSKEFFRACEKRFVEGKRAIVGHAARTLVALEDCPAGLSARQLLDFSLCREHRHPVTAGCVFGEGRNTVAWCTYWEGPKGTVARFFHAHPFAVVNDRALWFDRETVDLDLLERFTKDEIHVVVDADEVAFAELRRLFRKWRIRSLWGA